MQPILISPQSKFTNSFSLRHESVVGPPIFLSGARLGPCGCVFRVEAAGCQVETAICVCAQKQRTVCLRGSTESWRPEGGEYFETSTILTIRNQVMEPIHNRMPVIQERRIMIVGLIQGRQPRDRGTCSVRTQPNECWLGL